MDQAFEQLLAAARAGAEDAWRRIYDGLAPSVVGYLRGRGAPEPEDLAAEVFIQVVRDLDRFDGDGRGFRAWVMTIAHHRLLDDVRHRARRPVQPMAEPPEPSDGRPAPDAASEVAKRLALGRVGELLSGLSVDQQTVILLRIVGELTIEEVAVVIGKEPGAVKQLQRRGLLAVRRQLEREVHAR